MFVMIDLISCDLRFKGRVYSFFSLPDIFCERVETRTDLPFFIMRVKYAKGKIPFEQMSNILGSLKSYVIFKDKIALPENCPIKPLECEKLKRKLLFNSATDFIKSLNLAVYETKICVCDNEGEYINDIESLVFVCNEIYVVTSKEAPYKKLRHYLLEKYGVSLIITDTLQKAAKDVDFIISYNEKDIPFDYKGVLFCSKKRPLFSGKCISFEGIDLPMEYESLCPEGFDKLSFACALYERCADERIAKLKYSHLLT